MSKRASADFLYVSDEDEPVHRIVLRNDQPVTVTFPNKIPRYDPEINIKPLLRESVEHASPEPGELTMCDTPEGSPEGSPERSPTPSLVEVPSTEVIVIEDDNSDNLSNGALRVETAPRVLWEPELMHKCHKILSLYKRGEEVTSGNVEAREELMRGVGQYVMHVKIFLGAVYVPTPDRKPLAPPVIRLLDTCLTLLAKFVEKHEQELRNMVLQALPKLGDSVSIHPCYRVFYEDNRRIHGWAVTLPPMPTKVEGELLGDSCPVFSPEAYCTLPPEFRNKVTLYNHFELFLHYQIFLLEGKFVYIPKALIFLRIRLRELLACGETDRDKLVMKLGKEFPSMFSKWKGKLLQLEAAQRNIAVYELACESKEKKAAGDPYWRNLRILVEDCIRTTRNSTNIGAKVAKLLPRMPIPQFLMTKATLLESNDSISDSVEDRV